MTALKQRNDAGALFLRRVGLVTLFLLVCAGVWSVWGAWRKERESADLRVRSEVAAADLAQQESHLQDKIASLQSDRGKEAALRDQYAVGKQGEHLIVIVDQTPPPPPPPEPTLLDKIKGVFWRW